MLPKPWPLGHALRKVEELCAIRKSNVTVALLFQTPIELKRKKGRPMDVRGRPLEPIGVLTGWVRGTPIHGDKLGRVHLVPNSPGAPPTDFTFAAFYDWLRALMWVKIDPTAQGAGECHE